MKTFKQYLQEMPTVSNSTPRTYFHPDDHGPITHTSGTRTDGYGTELTHLGTHGDEGNRYYSVRHSEDDTPGHRGFRVTNSNGQTMFDISGHGTKGKVFTSSLAEAGTGRNISYSGVIHTLVTQGHVREWRSDTRHSPGSKKAYTELAKRPDLRIEHKATNGIRTPIKSPEDVERVYSGGDDGKGIRGRFIVKKAPKK